MYAKTLLGGQPPVPGLVGTTQAAAVLLPQLLQRGWAALGDPPSPSPAGELLISGDRPKVVVDSQVLLEDANAAGPDGCIPISGSPAPWVWCSALDRRGQSGVSQLVGSR